MINVYAIVKNLFSESKISFPILTKILSVAPISLLILSGWWAVYDYGTYINWEGNVVHHIPLDKPLIIIVDSTEIRIVKISIVNNPFGSFSEITYKGNLPEDIKAYKEGNEFVVEEPLPKGSKVHIAWTPWYLISKAIHESTDDSIKFLGWNGKIFMKELHNNLFFLGLGIFIFEFFGYKHNKKHNKLTVFNFYKIQIIQVKQQIKIKLDIHQ